MSVSRKADMAAAVQLLDAGRYAEALRIGKAVLKAQPRSPKVLEFCGVCAVYLEDMPAAQKYFSRLVKVVPDEGTHWANLGYAYFTAGELKRAEHAYRQAAKYQPGNPKHFMDVALCRGGQDDLEGAAEWFSKALAIAPDHPRALQGLANVRRQQLRPFEALPLLRRLAEQHGAHDPTLWLDYADVALSTLDVPGLRRAIGNTSRSSLTDAEQQMRIGHLWNAIGETEEAVAAVDRVLALSPDDPAMLRGTAIVHVDAGAFDTAKRYYERIVDEHPEIAGSYFSLSQLRRFRRESEDDAAFLATMERALDLELDDPAMLHYALGKALDDLDEPDRAFDHFSIANALRREEWPYSPEPDQALAARMKRHFPAGSVDASPADIPDDVVSPIFIVGMPRSGTTLVEQIVAAHPDVAACGEIPLLPNILANCFREDQPAPSPEAWKEIGDLYRDRVSGLAKGRPRVTDKLLGNSFNVGAIWTALPDARVISLQRHPYDVGISCFQVAFKNGLDFASDLAMIGDAYRREEDLREHWKQVAPQRILKVRYEDLVDDPEAVTRQILAYCGLDWHPDCARFYEKRRRVATASFNQVNRPIYTSSVGKWRRYEAHLKPLIESLGG